MNRLCTICARGGSKGLKNKNIKDLLGQPLIAYSIQQAQKSGLFNYIVVSSDSEDILQIAKSYGANYVIQRPSELAEDHVAKLPVIQHCVQEAERIINQKFDTFVDLDATSPLREANDIKEAVKLLEEKGVSNVITGMPARRSPYFNQVELNEQGFVELSKKINKSIVRRQDAPKCYDMNASIYIWRRSTLFNSDSIFNKDTLLYEMPEERSIDIDSELDYEIVKYLMKKKEKIYEENLL